MNFLKTTLSILAIAFILVLSACSSDNSSTNPTDTSSNKLTCVVNGGSYSNKAINIDKTAASAYDPSTSMTVCSFDNSASDAAVVGFKGNKTGTYTVDDDNTIVITLDNNKTILVLISGSIKVTSYGNVGGSIQGTFTGSGVVTKSNGLPDNVTVTNGTFKALRVN